jgi:cytochrome c-type biogenesis protein CcmH
VKAPCILVALLVALLVVPVGIAAETPVAADLEAELVCPTCGTTLDQSDAPIARRMKTYIRERIDAGATGQQIKDELVAQFGPAVLSEPPKHGFDLLAWLLPLGGLGLGVVVVGALALTWSRRRDGDDTPTSTLDPAMERRIDRELEQFDT